VASFVVATSALTLSTYNTVQIYKLESAIEAQKQKTDLLTDITRIHKQHLHQLHRMIDTIGQELKALKVQSGLHFSIDKYPVFKYSVSLRSSRTPTNSEP
jgi:hypothetical protein